MQAANNGDSNEMEELTIGIFCGGWVVAEDFLGLTLPVQFCAIFIVNKSPSCDTGRFVLHRQLGRSFEITLLLKSVLGGLYTSIPSRRLNT